MEHAIPAENRSLMIRSMTAYASVERELGAWLLAWELRTVNHRFLDMSLRLPEPLRFLEFDARGRIAALIGRGRIECSLVWKSIAGAADSLTINRERASDLLCAVAEVEHLTERAWGACSALDVLAWPGVLQEAEFDRDRFGAEILAALEVALRQVVAARQAEGRQLAALIEQRLARIGELVASIRSRQSEVHAALRQKFETKFQELQLSVDSSRLEQELVYWLQKLDVAEELDRIESHLGEFRRSLGDTDPVGRRLDFLAQELNREANTLASKSADAATSKAAVEIKVCVEQIREQVQNVE